MSTELTKLDPLPTEMIGLRLDKALALLEGVNSRSQAALLIENKHVRVNGKFVKSSYLMEAGDVLEVELAPPPPSGLVAWDHPLEILFEDEDLIVVNKPAGLVVHPAAGHHQDTLVNALLFHTQNLSEGSAQDRPGLVHRIDKETSGLLVIAKNNFSHEHLSQQFKNRTTHRKYFAVVEGKLRTPAGSVESFLARHPTHRKKYASVRDPKTKKILTDLKNPPPLGKWARTHFKSLSSIQNLHYLELKLETGRTHQIRVHLSELGCPIVGDVLYGSKKELPRFYLHAAELGFVHPKKGETLFFKKSWPDSDLEQLKTWGFDGI